MATKSRGLVNRVEGEGFCWKTDTSISDVGSFCTHGEVNFKASFSGGSVLSTECLCTLDIQRSVQSNIVTHDPGRGNWSGWTKATWLTIAAIAMAGFAPPGASKLHPTRWQARAISPDEGGNKRRASGRTMARVRLGGRERE